MTASKKAKRLLAAYAADETLPDGACDISLTRLLDYIACLEAVAEAARLLSNAENQQRATFDKAYAYGLDSNLRIALAALEGAR